MLPYNLDTLLNNLVLLLNVAVESDCEFDTQSLLLGLRSVAVNV